MCSGPIVQNLSYNKGLTAASRGRVGWEKRAFISISNAETAQLRYQNRPESHRNQNAGDFTFRDEFAVDSLLQRRVINEPSYVVCERAPDPQMAESRGDGTAPSVMTIVADAQVRG